jgi:hypothetical protein
VTNPTADLDLPAKSQKDIRLSVVGVKAIDGLGLPDFDSRWNTAVAEHRMADVERGLALPTCASAWDAPRKLTTRPHKSSQRAYHLALTD